MATPYYDVNIPRGRGRGRGRIRSRGTRITAAPTRAGRGVHPLSPEKKSYYDNERQIRNNSTK